MSSERWHANIIVNDEIVRTCLQAQFPELTPIRSLEQVGEGWDNTVYLVNDTIIFRFPRRKIAVQLIERENAILGALQVIKGLNIPEPLYYGKPSAVYPYPFHGYQIIMGQSGERAHLSEQKRNESIVVLAQFLKQLHGIHAAQALKLGALPQVFDRTDVKRLVHLLSESIEKINVNGIASINRAIYNYEVERVLNIQLPKDSHCLIHGDLYFRHLIFNEGRLTGVIDWGDTGINSPAIDLMVVWSFYPQSCHAQFLNIYGAVDPSVWAYSRFLGLYSGIMMLMYGHDVKDELLVKEALGTINRINPALLAPPNLRILY